MVWLTFGEFGGVLVSFCFSNAVFDGGELDNTGAVPTLDTSSKSTENRMHILLIMLYHCLN